MSFKGERAFAEETIAEEINDFNYIISIGGGEQRIDCFLHNDTYYLFLPSGTETWKVGNIDTDDSVWVHDDTLEFYNASKNKTQIVPFVVMQSENTGSLFIDLGGNSREYLDSVRKMKLQACITMFDEEGRVDNSGELKFIRTRGNGTFAGAKKPYEIKFNEKTAVLGMKKAKQWVLLANHFDRSLLRNKLIYDFAENYTSLKSEDGRYVDVFINGEFLGNYYLCEKVEVGKNRVNIADQDKNTNCDDITGGYLVELLPDFLITAETKYFTTDSGYKYEIKSPENPTEEQIAYIKGVFDDLESAVKSEEGYSKISGKHYSELIDVDSYIQKYLVETVFMNSDIDYNSQYYYKDADSVDPKLYAGPVWDYDMALNYKVEPYTFLNFYLKEDLFKYQEVKEKYLYYYNNIFKSYIENDLEYDLKDYKTTIQQSFNMNMIRWEGTFEKYSYGYSSVNANADYIFDRLNERLEYIDDFNENEGSYCYVNFSESEYVSRVKTGEQLGTINKKTVNWYQLFDGWELADTGEKITENTIVNKNEFCRPVMVDADILMTKSLSEIENSDIDLSKLNPNDLDKIANVIERMQTNENIN